MARSASSTTAGAASKGKARALDAESHEAAAPDLSGPSAGTAAAPQVGDRTDNVARTQAGERLLKAIRDAWDDHEACTKKLKDVLKYVVSSRRSTQWQ